MYKDDLTAARERAEAAERELKRKTVEPKESRFWKSISKGLENFRTCWQNSDSLQVSTCLVGVFGFIGLSSYLIVNCINTLEIEDEKRALSICIKKMPNTVTTKVERNAGDYLIECLGLTDKEKIRLRIVDKVFKTSK